MARTRRRRANSISDPTLEPPLDVERIVTTALDLLNHVGLERLSMRRLAERLGIQASTLYWYVRDKHELLGLLAEVISSEVRPPDPKAPWRIQIETIMWDYRRVLLAHRDAAHILVVTLPSGSHRLRLVELTLGAVIAAGFEGWAASRAGRLLVDFTTGFVQEETITAARPSQVAAERDSRKVNSAHLLTLADAVAMPTFPNLAMLSPYLVDRDGDARFRFGLEVVLDGLEQRLVRSS